MSLPQWKGLWDWSIKHADSAGAGSGFRPDEIDPEKMKWLDDALKHYMVDFAARMMEIKTALQRDTTAASAAAAAARGQPGRGDDQQLGSETTAAAAPSDLAEREALLEELMDIVSSIDYARDLHKIGGLPVLLELLASPHPSLQWRAAEVVATCVANNPPVQQWFLDGGVLPRLLALAGPSEPDGTVRTKALLALSGLVRHFGPGLQALRDAGGLALLVSCLPSLDRRISRKATALLTYVLAQRAADCAAAVRAGALTPLVAQLHDGGAEASAPAAAAAPDGAAACGAPSSQSSSDMRQAALGALLQLASCSDTWAAVRDSPGLQGRLSELRAAHAALSADDREAAAEEGELAGQLAAVLEAAVAPPAGVRLDGQDQVSVAAFEEAGRGTTFTVNDGGQGSREAVAVAPPLLLGAP